MSEGTPEAARAALRDARARVTSARDAGDAAAEIEAQHDAVLWHLALGQTEEAAKRLRRTRALHQAGGLPAEAARDLLTLGLLQARVPVRRAEAEHTLAQVLDEAAAAGDPGTEGRALSRLAALAGDRGDLGAADDRLGAAAAAHARAGETGRRVQALRLQGLVRSLDERPAEGMAALVEALEVARAGGDEDTALALRLDIDQLGRDDPTAPESPAAAGALDDAVDRARRAGSPGTEAAALLTRAGRRSARGDLAAAAQDAAAARAAARRAVDPVAYLVACLMQAELEELRGDDAGALGVLFSCQASLGDLLGPAAAEPVLRVIDGARVRWGEGRFGAALEEHRRRV